MDNKMEFIAKIVNGIAEIGITTGDYTVRYKIAVTESPMSAGHWTWMVWVESEDDIYDSILTAPNPISKDVGGIYIGYDDDLLGVVKFHILKDYNEVRVFVE